MPPATPAMAIKAPAVGAAFEVSVVAALVDVDDIVMLDIDEPFMAILAVEPGARLVDMPPSALSAAEALASFAALA